MINKNKLAVYFFLKIRKCCHLRRQNKYFNNCSKMSNKFFWKCGIKFFLHLKKTRMEKNIWCGWVCSWVADCPFYVLSTTVNKTCFRHVSWLWYWSVFENKIKEKFGVYYVYKHKHVMNSFHYCNLHHKTKENIETNYSLIKEVLVSPGIKII
jgi:hypothetical protein